MDIVLVTTGNRMDLLQQTVATLIGNSEDWGAHELTVVWDSPQEVTVPVSPAGGRPASCYVNRVQRGASDSRNAGACSIPPYRRQKWLMFCDDDCYFLPSWDTALTDLAKQMPKSILSPYGHPYNQEEARVGITSAKFPIVISSVCMFMSWAAFAEIGFWDLPGGPGGSEDVAYCARAKALGYDFAVLYPNRVIHTGLVSSRGDRIVGYDLLLAKNNDLMQRFGVPGVIQHVGK